MIYTGPIRGEFPSLKLGRMVRYSSSIERDLLYFLEYWQIVTWYQEQPKTIEWVMKDNQVHRYTPDYEIHEGTLRSIAECKPVSHLESSQAVRQREIGQAWAEAHGYQFITFTDTELRRGHQLDNLKLFWRYARLRQLQWKQPILEQMGGRAGGSVKGLCQQLHILPEEAMPVVCYLLFHQHLHTDLNLPFSISTPLWLVRR
ncbi:hypothetical protein ANRL4_03790 [Anaerolineae bacterium]|nr:hypothetical protein ANRL4_03790 [Anaerolineae bacterium]